MERTVQHGISRRGFVLIAALAGMTIAAGGALAGCGSSNSGDASANADVDYASWDAVLEAAKGQTVSWYGWGGSEPRNTWLANVLAPALKSKYDVTLDVVGMDINDVLSQLSGEMQAKVEKGSIDFIWINGENFYSAKENGYLWGPFTEYLPNFNEFCDASSPELSYDFGGAIEGFEAPYAKAQLQFWLDGSKHASVPKNPEEFLAFCKQNEGKVTYPQPGDFTGTAFISSLIAGVVGKDRFEKLSMMGDATPESVREVVEPGLEYLRSLNPYLWNQGRTFPADFSTVSTMFADGELALCMGYNDPQPDVDNGALPATTKTFVFDTGTVGNTNFMAIAKNAPHKAAALVAINEMLSPEMQLAQFEALGFISVLDMAKLKNEDLARFEAVEVKSAQLPISELLAHRVSEPAGPVVPILERLWLDEVVGK